MKWRITAEHTQGAGVGHPCSDGVHDDPADMLAEIVQADSQDAAEHRGRRILEERVCDLDDCPCGRVKRWCGSEKWWASVAIIAEPAD